MHIVVSQEMKIYRAFNAML